jgi:protein-S-isoprenylcysteine O-methyltransferase Ste14
MTGRGPAIVGSAIFLVVAPGLVAGVVPWWISHWRMETPFFGTALSRFAGGALLGVGVIGLLDSFARFAFEGLGTPAPIFPTQHLVISGLYRYVRNPMYVAVVSAIFGQALIFADVRLLKYGSLVWLLMHFFVVFYEEPKLTKSFGAEYQTYRRKVPRWIPHFGS